jgi:hypothetical protein
MDAKSAETLAIEALSLLVENPESLARFLALTGIDPADLRQIAQEPAFLGAVLEHVANDRALLAELSLRSGRDPAAVDAARIALSGRDWERDTA